MRLGLSSSAAPGLALRELVEACACRGLTGVELVAGEGHGLGPATAAREAARAQAFAAEHGVRILGYRAGSARHALSPATVRFAAALQVPVLVAGLEREPALVRQAAELYGAAGARLVLLHGSDIADAAIARTAVDAAASSSLALGWEVRPGSDDLAGAARIIEAGGEHLCYACLYGGGPESVSHTGQGVGALMARLALARYAGPLVLAPSSERNRQAWSQWLLRRGGWGCGSKDADATLVQLSA